MIISDENVSYEYLLMHKDNLIICILYRFHIFPISVYLNSKQCPVIKKFIKTTMRNQVINYYPIRKMTKTISAFL